VNVTVETQSKGISPGQWCLTRVEFIFQGCKFIEP